MYLCAEYNELKFTLRGNTVPQWDFWWRCDTGTGLANRQVLNEASFTIFPLFLSMAAGRICLEVN